MRLRRIALAGLVVVLAALLVGCEPERVSLQATPATPAVGQRVTLELKKVTSKAGDLVIAENQTTLKRCNGADRCSISVTSAMPVDRRFTGALVTPGSNLDSIIFSEVVVVQWVDSRVTLSPSATSVPAGTAVVLTAQATSATIAPDAVITIYADDQAARVCTGQARCVHRVSQTVPGMYAYSATIARPGAPVVESDIVLVEWYTASTTTQPIIGTPEPPPVDPGHPGV